MLPLRVHAADRIQPMRSQRSHSTMASRALPTPGQSSMLHSIVQYAAYARDAAHDSQMGMPSVDGTPPLDPPHAHRRSRNSHSAPRSSVRVRRSSAPESSAHHLIQRRSTPRLPRRARPPTRNSGVASRSCVTTHHSESVNGSIEFEFKMRTHHCAPILIHFIQQILVYVSIIFS
jgi:hypothetical protein